MWGGVRASSHPEQFQGDRAFSTAPNTGLAAALPLAVTRGPLPYALPLSRQGSGQEDHEDNEEDDEDEEDFDHEPSIGSDRLEVLEDLGVSSLNVQLSSQHILVDPGDGGGATEDTGLNNAAEVSTGPDGHNSWQ